MATKQRKERRLKERLAAGDAAIAEISPLRKRCEAQKVELEAVRASLAQAEERASAAKAAVARGFDKARELDERITALTELHDAVLLDNATLRSELSEARRLLNDQRYTIESLRRADKDAAKLRRRLAAKSDEVKRLRSRVSSLSSSEVW
jgi:chromosome segregation ATPase